MPIFFYISLKMYVVMQLDANEFHVFNIYLKSRLYISVLIYMHVFQRKTVSACSLSFFYRFFVNYVNIFYETAFQSFRNILILILPRYFCTENVVCLLHLLLIFKCTPPKNKFIMEANTMNSDQTECS